ncbi:hypothetical protein C9F11_21380 [Streptomyces sp. YIM 121038]|uniref:hypothetical protein n=1 Tax=Streptomyces sp. YIM 121038 TaxID=2136401 RepID=UPI0011624E3E|nr:hypothetical protein [Streptomyces sp. YIM 121038]QCX77908.1 hypothetical protein C9F11_21380 [Streptomyces sp. YIM 121038]
MRALPARRIATTTLCAALLLGTAGPAIAMQAEARQEATAVKAPVPGADALLGQVTALGDLGSVLTPVTDLLEAALKADNGQLPVADATKLVDAVKEAIAKITAGAPVAPPAALPAVPQAPAAPAVPQTPAAPAVPPAPAVPQLPAALPKLPLGGPQAAQVPLDVKDDALKALQTAVDTLLKAVTSGDPTQVVPAVTSVVTGLVNVVVATVLSGGLPIPNLPGLPALPKLPTDALPLPKLPVPLPLEE